MRPLSLCVLAVRSGMSKAVGAESDSDGLDLTWLFPSVQTMHKGRPTIPFLSWSGNAVWSALEKDTLGHFPTSHFSRAFSLPLHGEVQMTWPSARTTSRVHLALSGPGPERRPEALSPCSAMAGRLNACWRCSLSPTRSHSCDGPVNKHSWIPKPGRHCARVF